MTMKPTNNVHSQLSFATERAKALAVLTRQVADGVVGCGDYELVALASLMAREAAGLHDDLDRIDDLVADQPQAA